MLKRIKVINEKTKEVLIMSEKSNEDWAVSNGYSRELVEVEQAYDDLYYLKGFAPAKPAPTKEEIRSIREQLFSSSPCSDYKYDYEEAVARYGADSEQAISTSKIWLAQKDKIRADNPYPVEV